MACVLSILRMLTRMGRNPLALSSPFTREEARTASVLEGSIQMMKASPCRVEGPSDTVPGNGWMSSLERQEATVVSFRQLQAQPLFLAVDDLWHTAT